MLHRRTWHIAVSAEYTAVAIVGFEQRVAVRTFIEPLASVGGHGFTFLITTYGAGDGRFCNHDVAPWVCSSRRKSARQQRPDGFLDSQAHKPAFVCWMTKALIAGALPFVNAAR